MDDRLGAPSYKLTPTQQKKLNQKINNFPIHQYISLKEDDDDLQYANDEYWFNKGVGYKMEYIPAQLILTNGCNIIFDGGPIRKSHIRMIINELWKLNNFNGPFCNLKLNKISAFKNGNDIHLIIKDKKVADKVATNFATYIMVNIVTNFG